MSRLPEPAKYHIPIGRFKVLQTSSGMQCKLAENRLSRIVKINAKKRLPLQPVLRQAMCGVPVELQHVGNNDIGAGKVVSFDNKLARQPFFLCASDICADPEYLGQVLCSHFGSNVFTDRNLIGKHYVTSLPAKQLCALQTLIKCTRSQETRTTIKSPAVRRTYLP